MPNRNKSTGRSTRLNRHESVDVSFGFAPSATSASAMRIKGRNRPPQRAIYQIGANKLDDACDWCAELVTRPTGL